MDFLTNNDLVFYGITGIMLLVILLDVFKDRILPIKYKLDDEGYVMFYYPKYGVWKYFPAWNDNDDDREVNVFDRTRNLNYVISYKGPGRCKIKIPCTDPKKYSSKDIKKRFPSYKHPKEIWEKHCLYVDKENTILNDIVKNHKFKAYEGNS